MYSSVMLFLSVILLASCVMMRDAEGVMCRQQEREALLDLKNATEGGFYFLGERAILWFPWEWDEQEEECCAWQGVHCDVESGRVNEVRLPPHLPQWYYRCSPLPSSLSRLEALEVLDLRGGCFSGAISPLTFSTLTNLSYLDLSGNAFQTLPELPLLPHLTYLNLSSNNLIGNLSKLVMSSVPNLQYLDLSNNGLEGVIPEQIGTLQNLLYLNLVSNSFYNPVPWQSLANLSRLTNLNLGNDWGQEAPVLVWEASQAASQWQCNWKALESLSCLGMRFASKISIPFCLKDPRVVSKLKDLSFHHHVESIGPLLRSFSLANDSLRLKTLSFSGTSLSEFEAENPKQAWLHALDMPFLEVLDVSLTGLTGIPFWLPHLPHLHSLDMSKNSLSEFPRNLLNGSLESLFLSDNAITGAIPLFLLKPSLLHLDVSNNLLSAFSLGNLSSLSYLDLSMNTLTGVVPLSLGRLSNLSYLDLSSNKLKGEIPLSIGELSNLVILDLSFNSLRGAIPLSVGNMSNLVSLYLSSNSLRGAIPLSVGNMSNLVVMSLDSNKLSGTIPVSIGNLSVLNSLSLSENYITGTIPTSVFQSSLAELDLSSNQLVGSLPRNLQNCSLNEVYVSYNNLSGSSLVLQNCELLWYVDLSNNRFTGDLSQYTFHSWKELTLLDMSNNQHIWGEIPREIGNCSGLVALILSNNIISGNIPRELFNHMELSILDLSSNNLIGALPTEIGNCSGLLLLNIGKNSLSLGIPVSLGKLQKAGAFVFGTNKFNGGIPAALQNCSSLIVLDLSDNQLSGTIPDWIRGENLPNLQLLMLSSNRLQGSLQVLESSIQNLTTLKVLGLASNFLSGSIPSNVNHLQGMTNKAVPGNRMSPYYDVSYIISSVGITIKGSDRLFLYDDYWGNNVTALDFSNNLLEGEIPLEIGALNGLYSLNLSHNALNGSIPSSLGELAGVLESLDLSNNRLTGAIPSKLCLFSSLGYLNLSNNRLKGAITLSSSCTLLCTFDASSYAGNGELLYECYAPPAKSHDTPNMLPASPPPLHLHLTLVAKLQEHISLEGMGLGHLLGFLLMILFLHRRALFTN